MSDSLNDMRLKKRLLGKHVGEILTLIKSRGIRQQDLANGFGIGRATISNWMNGRRKVPRQYWPDLWALAGLCQTYGVAALNLWTPTVSALGRSCTDMWAPILPSMSLPEDPGVLLRALAPFIDRHLVNSPLTPVEAETLRVLSTALSCAALGMLMPQVYAGIQENAHG